MQQQQPDLSDLWTKHQRRNNKTTQSWACLYCVDRKIFTKVDDLWNHALFTHQDKLPPRQEDIPAFRAEYESRSFKKRSAALVFSYLIGITSALRLQPLPPFVWHDEADPRPQSYKGRFAAEETSVQRSVDFSTRATANVTDEKTPEYSDPFSILIRITVTKSQPGKWEAGW